MPRRGARDQMVTAPLEVPAPKTSAGRLRGQPTLWATPRDVNMAGPIIARMIVGASVRRKDGVEKLTGRARYVDDIALPGMLHGRTVRSPVPRGRLERIDFDPALPW